MILVTGATGMLGAHLLTELTKTNDTVKALKRKNSNLGMVEKIFSYQFTDYQQYYKKVEWHEADVLDIFSLQNVFTDITNVYHCAAMVSFNPADKIRMIQNNATGTANVVNICVEKNIRLCHVSSIAALGIAGNGEFVTEQTIRKPSKNYSGYSISKFNSEMEVWRGIEEGLNAVIVNPSVILGAGNWKTGSPSFFYNAWKGMPFYTLGTTGFVDVLDVVKCMVLLMNSEIKSERFIVNSENLDYKYIFTQLAINLNKTKPKYKAGKALLNIAKNLDYIKSKLTFSEQTLTSETVDAALNKTYYSNQKICKTLDYKFIEIEKTISRIAENFLSEMEKMKNI